MSLLLLLLLLFLSAISAQLSATERETVAIIGTGDMGDSIGAKLAKMGYRVIYGSRDPSEASVRQLVALTGNNAQAATQQEAAQQAEFVELEVLPSNYWLCIWQDEWYTPVSDSENLAVFPDPEVPSKPCSPK